MIDVPVNRIAGRALVGACIILILFLSHSLAYPLDGSRGTGIRRLGGIHGNQARSPDTQNLLPGALLSTRWISPRLLAHPDLVSSDSDPVLTETIEELLGKEFENCRLALLVLSIPNELRYAEHPGNDRQIFCQERHAFSPTLANSAV